MNKYSLAVALAAALTASGAMAQNALGTSAAQDRIENLNDDIADDFTRDVPTFGNDGRALGFTGSMSLQANATSGNTDTASIGVGLNMGYYDGTNGYRALLSYQYSENNGTTDEDDLVYELQYTRDLNYNYYGFAKLQGTVESLPADTSDNYLGLGVGYRIYNDANTQWSVEAGAGYRVADLNSISDLDEAALSLSSNYYNRINDQMSLTWDIDVIGSESDTVVFNDLGINVNMTDTLALRTSLATEYHTDPEPGKDDTDNKLGMSLVYSFN